MKIANDYRINRGLTAALALLCFLWSQFVPLAQAQTNSAPASTVVLTGLKLPKKDKGSIMKDGLIRDHLAEIQKDPQKAAKLLEDYQNFRNDKDAREKLETEVLSLTDGKVLLDHPLQPVQVPAPVTTAQATPLRTRPNPNVDAQQTAPQTPLKSTPTGEVTNGGGTTPAGTHYDYKKVTTEGTTYFRVLRSREEIDAFLVKQAQQIPTEDNIRLRDMPWTVMQHEWRRDPVTRQPVTEFPPPQDQQKELVEAFKNRLGLSPEAADEFQAKLAAGNCIMHDSLDPTRMVVMVNGTGVNEKLEVPPQLAAKTRSCEFFLESVPVVLNLVLICGNFGYDFVDFYYVANPKPPENTKVERPGQANCEVSRNGQVVNTAQPIKMGLSDSVTFTGRSVGDISNLQLVSEIYVNNDLQGKMAFMGSQEFAIGPDITHQQAGTYNGVFTLVDQFGRRADCPFSVVIDRVPPPPPPQTAVPSTSFVPPVAPPYNPYRIEQVKEHHGCGTGCKTAIGALIAGGVICAFVCRRGKSSSAVKTSVDVFQGHP